MPVALFGGFATFVCCCYVSSWGWSEVKSCNMACVCVCVWGGYIETGGCGVL